MLYVLSRKTSFLCICWCMLIPNVLNLCGMISWVKLYVICLFSYVNTLCSQLVAWYTLLNYMLMLCTSTCIMIFIAKLYVNVTTSFMLYKYSLFTTCGMISTVKLNVNTCVLHIETIFTWSVLNFVFISWVILFMQRNLLGQVWWEVGHCVKRCLHRLSANRLLMS